MLFKILNIYEQKENITSQDLNEVELNDYLNVHCCKLTNYFSICYGSKISSHLFNYLVPLNAYLPHLY